MKFKLKTTSIYPITDIVGYVKAGEKQLLAEVGEFYSTIGHGIQL